MIAKPLLISLSLPSPNYELLTGKSTSSEIYINTELVETLNREKTLSKHCLSKHVLNLIKKILHRKIYNQKSHAIQTKAYQTKNVHKVQIEVSIPPIKKQLITTCLRPNINHIRPQHKPIIMNPNFTSRIRMSLMEYKDPRKQYYQYMNKLCNI